jgi:glycosyltransferase involved in cell wall biosynthesis
MLPKISVIIPTYNNALFLQEAIDCVFAQEYGNIEVIIVDDGSTDDTLMVLSHIKNDTIRYFSIPHAGAGAARNYGIQQSQGTYLAFLDADDLWPDNKLHQQIAYLITHDQDAVFTSIIQFLEPHILDKKIKSNREVMSGLCASTMLINKDIFLAIGFFKTSYYLGEFIEWFMRAKHYGLKFAVLDEVITKRRIHGGNTSLNHKMHKRDYLSIITSSLRERNNDVRVD